ncbi:MAG: helix-turn-helix domain-containing protein [Actinobacteria bacterium]|nr:helix-turn-helix domain-containing protein [Actinomycetota bacterium]
MIDPNAVARARRALGRQLAKYRRAAGLNQHQLAPHTHYGRSTIANVEVGRQNVPRRFWERADATLGAGGSLVSQYDELTSLVQQQRREIAEASANYPVASNEQVIPVPTRRDVFGYLGAGLTSAGLQQIAARWPAGLPRVVHALEATRHAELRDSATLENLSTLIDHYKRTFRSTPPAGLYGEILGVRLHAGSLINSAVKAKSGPELMVAAGWLSNLLALVTHDLDDRAASLVWCADAERCAGEARHPELAGWAAQTRVLMSFYGGQAKDAVAHAQRGQRHAPLGTVAHAKLLTQEMRAWALLGNADKVGATRRRADEAIARLPGDAPTRGAFSISLTDDPPYTATSLLLLGLYQDAAEAARRVIAAFYGLAGEGRGAHPSGFACTYLVLALAQAGLGKLDEAYAAGSLALDAPRRVRPAPDDGSFS